MSRTRSTLFLCVLIGCTLFAAGVLYRFSPSRSPGRDGPYSSRVSRRAVQTYPASSHPQPSPVANYTPPLSLPLTLEANFGQLDPRIAFLARGQHLSIFLTRTGIDLQPTGRFIQNSNADRLHIEFANARQNSTHPAKHSPRRLTWKSSDRLRAESNYFIGRNPAQWHTHVPHFARANARAILPGIDVVAYANDTQLEYDLRIAPDAKVDQLRLNISGADTMRLNSTGDLLMQVGGSEIRMRKPVIYEETRSRELGRKKKQGTSSHVCSPIDGKYMLEAGGSIAFRIDKRKPNTTLVIDPSLSVEYSTFLGGAGEDTANSIALDTAGMVYIGGTTTSPGTFNEVPTKVNGPGGGTDFFVAKIDPTLSGASSLIYLTFLGGTGNENGGMIAVDKSANLAITGTTTSHDFPVTDASAFSSGTNDIAITELGPTGATLVYSTLFGGNGSESTQNPGGIAFDHAGEIFIASDTTSTDLPATIGAFQAANGGGISDGFLAIFRPTVTAPVTHLKYCSYFGINAQVGVGGVAVDAGDNAYIAGFTSDPGATFPTLNGYQPTYAGDPSDAFVIKIRPSGTGAGDLAYGTFLGGARLDKALAIAVGAAMPATAYVTGTTQSTNFPTNGSTGAAQTKLRGTANAFFSAIGQDGATGLTSLLYSTYVGGTQSDAGLSVFFVAPNALYVAGKTTSWDFPWLSNFQPFTGNEDAFVVKLDPTSGGAASLLYATPLAGTAPPGGTAVTDGNAIAASTSGQVYVAGRSTAADFPRASNPGNGLQIICASCQELPPAADAFVVAFQESAALAPSVSFTALKLNFGAQAIGTQNIPPLFASAINTGDAPLNLNSIAITGPDSAAFSLVGTDPCIGTPIQPHGACTFEVSFIPSVVGPEEAFVAVGDDAPGSPQVLSIVGVGRGPLAVLSSSNLAFANQPQGSISVAQTVTVLNEGNQDLHITNLSILGSDPIQFALEGDTCGSNPVPASSACSINIVFKPSGTASYQAEIDVIDDSGGVVGAKQVIALSGVGIAPAPIVSISPASLVFGIQAIATTSGSQSITLRNLGSTALNLSQIGISGPDASSFGISPGGTNACPVPSGTVAIASDCIVAVDFAPQSSGTKNATLSFVDNASGSPQVVAISGTAIAPTIQLSPTSLSFAPQSVGTMSASHPITLSNTGNSSVAINQISVSGANAGDFSESHNCSSVLGTTSSCIISVTFNPTAAGNRSASILISDDAAGGPHTVVLTGTATQPAVSLSPTSLNFSSQLIGSISAPVALTVSNSGSGVLLIGAISFAGTNPSDFLETDSCKGTVAPSATCVLNVTFAPAAIGARSAIITLADNSPNAPQIIPLTGAGMDFAIASTGATSQTVTAGATAHYQLNIQSMNGFTGPITLNCAWASAPPTGTACTFAPPTLNATANATTSFQVNISTSPRNQAVRNQAETTQAANVEFPPPPGPPANTRDPRDFRSQLQLPLATSPSTQDFGDSLLQLRSPLSAGFALQAPLTTADTQHSPSKFMSSEPSMIAFALLLIFAAIYLINPRPQESSRGKHIRVRYGHSQTESQPQPVQPAPPAFTPVRLLVPPHQHAYANRPTKSPLAILAGIATLAIVLALTLVSCSTGSTNATPPASSGTPPGTSTLTISATASGTPRTISLTLTID